MTKRMKHPTPWRAVLHGLADAEGHLVYVDGSDHATNAKRIVRAVNAYESPLARAERAVVREVVKRLKTIGRNGYTDLQWGGSIGHAVTRLLAARAKATRGGR